jgi:hypothetical protein
MPRCASFLGVAAPIPLVPSEISAVEVLFVMCDLFPPEPKLDSNGPTPISQNASIKTTFDTYGDCVTDAMSQAHSKVVSLALNGGSVCESNPRTNVVSTD